MTKTRASAASIAPALTTVGIDVGGPRKGFHSVALRDGTYATQLATGDAEALAHWCRSVVQARVIAIDAPCRWSLDGRARPCERELRQQGIICFASPTRQVAASHPSGYYDWMCAAKRCTGPWSPPIRSPPRSPSWRRPASKPSPTPSPGTGAAARPTPHRSAPSAASCCSRRASTWRRSPASTGSMPPSAP
ncbi:DUF429 domain-containing protein [Microcystis elabens FACHB-917]|nr:DUF429 domain-containing protein [Microcystis elabens FACHB-917]